MCSNTGVGGHKTNHSLRATSVIELFNRGAPEKLTPRVNRTERALRSYERSSEEQHKAASTLLSALSHLSHYSHIVNTSTKTQATEIHQATTPAQRFSSMPASFQNLQDCIINIIGSPNLK